MRFLGWRRDLPTIYAATDVFLLTSRNEGTPVALIEAMASGVPGVSTDVGGVRDVIDVDERRPRSRRSAMPTRWPTPIVALLGRRRRCARRWARAPGPHVLARYGIDRLVDDIDALYRELLARTGLGSRA